MKLLVTGGAGFIGSNFVDLLLRDGLELNFESVTVLDSMTYAADMANFSSKTLKDPRFSFIRGDVRDAKLVARLVTSADQIINFAAESHVDRSIENPTVFLETNVIGTLNILSAMKDSSNSHCRLLQVSTDEVYGSIIEGSWDEHSPLEPNSPYSASKAAADLLIRSFHKTYGLDVVVTRCCNNYGPRQFPEKLIPYFVKLLLAGEQVPVYGNGFQRREWIYVADHCRGIARALSEGQSGSVYHFGSSDEFSNIEIVKMMLEILNLDENYIKFVPDRPGHDIRYSLNCTKSYDELGFENSVNFSDGFRSTIEWYAEKFRANIS